MADTWNWKNKDGGSPGLLYESGNWGDLLKLLWVKAVIDWKQDAGGRVNYLDPFAGDVCYPLSRKGRHRIRSCGEAGFKFIQGRFLEDGLWPSAASGARLAAKGAVEVWDADAGRRQKWSEVPGVTVTEGESGWSILREHADDPDGVRLVDPYDFLAEWRDHLPFLLEQSRNNSTLLYIYNRSGKSDAAFKHYRDFKNALEDGQGSRPKRLGRIEADPFLPQSHHEMLFLPSDEDAASPDFEALTDELARQASLLADGLRRNAACES